MNMAGREGRRSVNHAVTQEAMFAHSGRKREDRCHPDQSGNIKGSAEINATRRPRTRDGLSGTTVFRAEGRLATQAPERQLRGGLWHAGQRP